MNRQQLKTIILPLYLFACLSWAVPHSTERLSLDSKSAELQQLDFQAQPSFKWFTKDELKNYTLAPQSVFIQKGKAPCVVNNSADPSLLPSFITTENSFNSFNSFNYSSLSNQPSFVYCDEDQKAFIRAGMEEAVYTQSLEEMLAERQLAAWPLGIARAIPASITMKTGAFSCIAGSMIGTGGTLIYTQARVGQHRFHFESANELGFWNGGGRFFFTEAFSAGAILSSIGGGMLLSQIGELAFQATRNFIVLPMICGAGTAAFLSHLLSPAHAQIQQLEQ